MNYLAIGLIIIIIVILYYFYYYLTNNALTSGLQDLGKNPLSVSYDKLINPNSLTYSYECWLYISASTTSPQKIFYRQTASGEFEVDISGQSLDLKAGTGTAATVPTQIMNITAQFPIQKWTYLVVNVYNMKTFEAYINGKLAKTVNIGSMDVTPTFKTSTLYIGNSGITGYVTKFIRRDKTLDAKTVWQNYLSGNGLTSYFSSFIPYGLNMSISKGEDVQRIVNVF